MCGGLPLAISVVAPMLTEIPQSDWEEKILDSISKRKLDPDVMGRFDDKVRGLLLC